MEPTSTQGTLKLSPLLLCENLSFKYLNSLVCTILFHYPFLKCTPSAFVKSIGNHLTQRIKIIGLLSSICPQRPKQYLWEEIVSKIEFLRGKKRPSLKKVWNYIIHETMPDHLQFYMPTLRSNKTHSLSKTMNSPYEYWLKP